METRKYLFEEKFKKFINEQPVPVPDNSEQGIESDPYQDLWDSIDKLTDKLEDIEERLQKIEDPLRFK